MNLFRSDLSRSDIRRSSSFNLTGELIGILHRLLGAISFRHTAVISLFLLASIPALGQTAPSTDENAQLGSIHGTLSNTQGGASDGLAGISVQLTANPPDGSAGAAADTDDAGHYAFKDLKPGSYTISVNQTGFKPVTKSVVVKAGEAAIVDIGVELLTVSEKVEVSETTQSIATEDATAPSVSLTQRQ